MSQTLTAMALLDYCSRAQEFQDFSNPLPTVSQHSARSLSRQGAVAPDSLPTTGYQCIECARAEQEAKSTEQWQSRSLYAAPQSGHLKAPRSLLNCMKRVDEGG